MNSIFFKNPTLYTLNNKHLTKVTIMDWGATITDVKVYVPSTNSFRNIVLGTEHNNYQNQYAYFGATIGRFANRLKNAIFNDGNNIYKLNTPKGFKHCLHGGTEGFNRKQFKIVYKDYNNITLSLLSPDGDQGFQGNLQLFVRYSLNDDNELTISYEATSDKLTPINITNHSYWNLNTPDDCGLTADTQTILNHKLRVNSSKMLAIDSEGIPTSFVDITNTDFDFTSYQTISNILKKSSFTNTQGIDHPFVIEKNLNTPCAELLSDDDLVKLEVYSNYPSIQVYSGNCSQNQPSRNKNKKYQNHAGFAIEPEYYPNSANDPMLIKECPLLDNCSKFSKIIKYKIITK
ncbi:MAG: aldose epimerase family protein [Succinivibrionaceae bacterium]